MIRSMTIRGLGPHEETKLDFDAMGANEVVGRSERGKTIIIDAVLFALFGQDRNGKPLDVRAIRDESDEVEVEITLHSGTSIRRVLRRDKHGRRGVTVREMNGVEHGTEKAFLGEMRGLGAAPKIVRQILVPMAWEKLVGGAGGGRPFRDLLATVLPKADRAEIVAELMEDAGFEFKRGDPISQADAEQIRRRANRKRDEARGDVDRLKKLIAASEANPTDAPSQAEIDAAVAVDKLGAAWDEYESAVDTWTDAAERYGYQCEDVAAWDERTRTLGARPDGDVDAIADAKRVVERLKTERHSLTFNRGQQQHALKVAEKKLDEAKQTRGPSDGITADINRAKREQSDAIVALEDVALVCPTCERDGWDGARTAAEERLDRANQWHADAEAAMFVEIDQLAERRLKAIEVAEAGVAEAEATLAKSEAEAAEIEKPLLDAERVLTGRTMAGRSAVEWEATRKAIGARPEQTPEPKKPAPPEMPNPTDDAVRKAAKTLDAVKESRGAARQRERDLGALRKTLADAAVHCGLMGEEAERLDALVDAVRAAPSVAARQQLGALGDLGPIELTLSDGGGVDVSVDGRPYHFASTGRIVVADAYLRAGIRRAARMSYLPLFVDQVQSVAGQPVPILPPTILLRTTEDDGIAVFGDSWRS